MSLKKVPFVRQMESSECGAACLTMILRYYGHYVSLTEVRSKCGVGRDGTSALSLQKAATSYGLDCKAFRLANSQLPKLILPAILHYQGHHFVVLARLNARHAWILDPANGIQKMTLNQLANSFTDVALQLIPNNQFTQKRADTIRYWKRYFDLLTNKHYHIGILLVVMLTLQVMGFLVPLGTQIVVDSIIPQQRFDTMYLMVIATVGFSLFYGLIVAARDMLLLHLQTHVDNQLISSFFRHLLFLPLSFFQHRTSGDLLSRLNNLTWFRDLLIGHGIGALLDSCLVIIYLIAMFIYSPALSLIVVILAFVRLFILLLLSPHIQTSIKKDLIAQANLQAYTNEVLQGIPLIKSTGLEEITLDRWGLLLSSYLQTTRHRSQLSILTSSILAGVQILSPMLVLLFGAQLVIQNQITLGMLLGFSSLAAMFLTPVGTLVATAQQLQVVTAAVERLQDVLDEKIEPVQLDAVKIGVTGHIEIKNLNFSYSESSSVLKDVSLNIESGKMVALVGKTGSGKSTLLKLMLGLHKPNQGEIYYDGYALSELNLYTIRNQIGVVLQRTFAFSGSIFSNIILNDPNISLEQVEWAAKVAELHEEITALPLGYFTILSEGSTNFSGGQLQRLSIARAVVRRPAILLFDEATSELDSVTEQRIQANLAELGLTRILAAHRLQTISQADDIFVLDDGKIVERGTHSELLEINGHYAELWRANQRDKMQEISK